MKRGNTQAWQEDPNSIETDNVQLWSSSGVMSAIITKEDAIGMVKNDRAFVTGCQSISIYENPKKEFTLQDYINETEKVIDQYHKALNRWDHMKDSDTEEDFYSNLGDIAYKLADSASCVGSRICDDIKRRHKDDVY